MLCKIDRAHHIEVTDFVWGQYNQLLEGSCETVSQVVVRYRHSLDGWIGEDSEHNGSRDGVQYLIVFQFNLIDVYEEGNETSDCFCCVLIEFKVLNSELVIIWI